MGRPYLIRTGESFRLPDGELLTGGQTIELEDDVALAHAHRVDPVSTEAPAEATTGPQDD